MPDMSPSEPIESRKVGNERKGVSMADEKLNTAGTDQDTKQAKKGKKKWPIVLGVIAVVVVAAGAGFFVWHEQPSFCGAICHSPMDQYVETYLDGSTDAYGNEVAEADRNGMMAYAHGQLDAADCLSCHKPSLSQQMTEGMHWVTGNYEILGTNAVGTVTMEDRSCEQLVEGAGMGDNNGDGNVNGDDFCLRSGCHVAADGTELLTRDQLIAATADLAEVRNPHLPQHGEVACSDCHKAHSQSVNYCSTCHSDAPIPDGWLTAAERNQIAQLSA